MTQQALDCVHHVSFVVWDLNAAIERYSKLLQVPMAERGSVGTRGAEVAVFKLRNLNLEIVAPAGPDSPLYEHLRKHGEGFFHMAFGVDDVDGAWQSLERRGVKMESHPYVAYKSWRIAYLRDDCCPPGVALHIIDSGAN